jgi:hypothetical protein
MLCASVKDCSVRSVNRQQGVACTATFADARSDRRWGALLHFMSQGSAPARVSIRGTAHLSSRLVSCRQLVRKSSPPDVGACVVVRGKLADVGVPFGLREVAIS